ncbi:MAG: tail fiber domain-containing protein [Patescibacteria group bacterium]
MKCITFTRIHWAAFFALAVVFVFALNFLPVKPANAATYCPYDSTQATCACPTYGPGVTCIEPQLYAQGSCYSDVRPCASNQRMNCDSGSCECNTSSYPCSGCTTAQTSVGTVCNHTPADAGDCADASQYTGQCGAWSCPVGTSLCSTPAPGRCVTNRVCPAGLTWDVCSDTCTTYYVLTNPVPAVSPQPANPVIEGNFTIFGDQSGEGDMYMSNGKAIRVESSGATTLNVGNWGGGAFTLESYGTIKGDDLVTDTGNISTSAAALNIGATTATVNIGGGSSSSGCTVTAAGDYSCTGNFVEAGTTLGNKYLAYGGYMQNNNPFSPRPGFYISEMYNQFHRGESRFLVTQTGFASFVSANLFDNNYENRCAINAGITGVTTIDVISKGEFPTSGVVYPEGFIYVNFYYSRGPETVSGRVQNRDGVWFNMSAQNVSASSLKQQWRLTVPPNNYIVRYEITVTSPVTASPDTWISEIEYYQTRPAGASLSVIDKYTPGKVYSNFSVKDTSNTAMVTLDTLGNVTAVGDVNVSDALCLRGNCITGWPESMPTGTLSGDMLRWDGSDWVSSSILMNSGSAVGIGTGGVAPAYQLDVRGGQTYLSSQLGVGMTPSSTIGVSGMGTNYGGYFSSTNGYYTMIGSSVGWGLYTPYYGYFGSDLRVGTGISDGKLIVRQDNAADIFNLYDGAANVFTVLDGGNVGIKTANPTYDLDVSGNVRITGTLTVEGSPLITGSGTANYIPRFTSASNIGNSLIYDSGTNIGIGTTSPASKVHVEAGQLSLTGVSANGVNVNGMTMWGGNAGGGLYARGNVIGGDDFFDFVAYDGIRLTTTAGGSYERMRITSAGNVGIGTATPEAKLHLRGEPNLKQTITRSTGGFAFYMNDLEIDNANGKVTLFRQGALGNADTPSMGYFFMGADTNTAYDNNAFRIYPGKTATFHGNVGIGTTTPTQKLQVVGGAVGIGGNNARIVESAGALYAMSDYGYMTLSPLNNGWMHIYTDRPNFIFNKSIYITGGRLASYNLDNLVLSAGGARNDLVIDNATGTTIINSGLRLPTGAAAGLALVSDASGNASWQPLGGIGGGGTANYLPKFSAASTLTNSQIFDDGTNVGIGIAAPTYKLDIVDNNAGSAGFRFTNGTNGASAQIQNRLVNDTGAIAYYGITASGYTAAPLISNKAFFGSYSVDTAIFTQTANNIIFGTGGLAASNERMRITAGGAVGVGTTTPSAPLHVASTANPGLQVGNGTTGYAKIGTSGWYDDGTYFSPLPGRVLYIRPDIAATYIYTPNIYLGSTSGQNIRLRDNQMFGDDWIANYSGAGRWGIGTVTPGYKLDIHDATQPEIRLNDSDNVLSWMGLALSRLETEYWFTGMNSTDNTYRIRQNGATDVVVIDSNGRMAIGTGTTVSGTRLAIDNQSTNFGNSNGLDINIDRAVNGVVATADTGLSISALTTAAIGPNWSTGAVIDVSGGRTLTRGIAVNAVAGANNVFAGDLSASGGSMAIGLKVRGSGATGFNRAIWTTGGLVVIDSDENTSSPAGAIANASGELLVEGDIESIANVRGAALCIGADCRSAWPASGVGGSGTQYGTAVWSNANTIMSVGPSAAGDLLISQGVGALPLHRTVSGDATIDSNGTVVVADNSHLHTSTTISGLDATNDFSSGTLPVVRGGTGAASLTDLIALGTHTTGTYVAGLTADTGIIISGIAGEGWSPTVKVNQSALSLSSIGGTLNLASQVTGTLPIANGGTNATTYTASQFIWYNGTSLVASGYSNASFASASHAHSAADITSGILSVARGGTGAASLTDLIALGAHTNGDYVKSLVAGSGVSIVGGTGEGSTPTISVTSVPPSGAASGDLSGTYPGPSVVDDSHTHTGTTISGLDAALDISSGTLAIARGGTNATTYTASQFLWYNGTSIVASGYAAGSFASASHGHAASDITSGILSVARGGTGQTSWTANGVLYASDAATIKSLSPGSNGQVLTLVAGVPAWSTPSTGIGGGGTTSYMPKFTSASTIGNSQVYDNGTNVGVGTTAPTYKFHVNGSLSATSFTLPTGAADGYYLESDASGNASWQPWPSVDNPIYDQNYVTKFATSILVNSIMYDNGTNVGISTTTPSSKLHVVGDGYFTGSLAAGGLSMSSTYGIRAQGSTMGGYFKDSDVSTYAYLAYGDYALYSSYNIRVGDTAYKTGSLVWTTTSDERTKRDVRDFTSGLDIIEKLRPVHYTYNGLAGTTDGHEDIGLIAQEVQKVAPWMVKSIKMKLHETDTEEVDLLQLDAGSLIFMNTNAILELKELVEGDEALFAEFKLDTTGRLVEIDEAVKKLENENVGLKTKTDELEQRLRQLEWQMLGN